MKRNHDGYATDTTLENKEGSIMAKKLELWGMGFILVSSFIQIFLLIPSQTITAGAIQYKLEEKIDHVYSITRSSYQKLHPEVTEPIFDSDQKSFSNYEYAEQNKDIESTQWQTNTLNNIVGCLFILGSLMLLIGKHLEIKSSF